MHEQALVERCRLELPELDVDAAAFVHYVHARRPDGTSVEEWLAEVQIIDLYVAFACLKGRPGAITVFDSMYSGDIAHALRTLDPRSRDDARQILHIRLFVGALPKIASYSGRGPLRRWLRVVAGRILFELVDKRERIADDWEVAAVPVAGDDPELAYLKAKYRAEYKQAFANALAMLGDRDRTILAQYHVDGLTIDQLGALYNVHRVTASRWVSKAQDELRQRVLELLNARLGLSTTELRNLTRLVRSQLSLSLARIATPR
jgi:RNA polymerase sigma-70 factor (ECF subfamily)